MGSVNATRVQLEFPLSPDGASRRAGTVAASHPSYRVESVNGTARVKLDLELPDDWRILDGLSSLLRSDRAASFVVNGERVTGTELFGGLRCFFRKQRAGKDAGDWCTPKSVEDRQLFPCRQVRVYDNDHLTDNSWYAMGNMGGDGVFRLDKRGITDRILSDLGGCVRCPIFDLDGTAEIVARLPEEIDPSHEDGWTYREQGPIEKWKVVKTDVATDRTKNGKPPTRDEKETLIERLARSVRSGGAGVAAASGTAPGTRNVPDTRYEDVGGMRDTISLLREAIELPITHPEVFERLGIRPHRGILFHGPPGTGKTLLARAVANESGAHFIAVSGPEILNRYWGQSEARLRSIFSEAKAKAPSVILFDEIDSFASSRDSMSESFEATLVSQLLSLMDGMNSLGRVCVIATTNRPSALDSALRRPGRFDHEIEVGLPDPEARLHILGIHTKHMPTEETLDLEQIVAHTGSYSGADLEALCREAALSCMRRSVNLRDLEKKISRNELAALQVTTYDFRNAMKRVGASIRR